MAYEGLVSVIIPTYNRAYCLARAVDSALAQTYPHIEVILIDDGSSDGTADMVAKRYGADPRVRYHAQPNGGISNARNTGLARATGAYVAFLDSDDEWQPWKTELQIACMRAHPELGMTWTDMVAIDPDGNIVNPSYLRQMYSAYRWFPTNDDLFHRSESLEAFASAPADTIRGRKFYFGDIGDEMIMGNLVHTSTVIVARSRAEEVGLFREDLRFSGEDYEYHLRTCRLGPVGYLDVASIRYQRGRSDQATVPGNSIHTASNFLRIIQPYLDSPDQLTRLSPQMQKEVLAEAHAWVGECRFELGEMGKARRHLLRSLLIKRWQARTTRLLLGSCLPPVLRQAARRLYRVARRHSGAASRPDLR
jgi:glycosyltransferase involved in cell wall biosynthesis